MKPTIFRRMMPVCAAENVFVEKLASTHSQTSVGAQSNSLRARGTAMRLDRTDEDKWACLFNPVIGSLTRDENIMHVTLTQASAADADELGFLLQLRNSFGAAVAHP